MQEVRCKKCGKLLFKVREAEWAEPECAEEAFVEIKCSRCKAEQAIDVIEYI